MGTSTTPSDDRKTTSSALDIESDNNTTFGSRLLKEDNDVFSHNAWDHVEWDQEQEVMAQEKVNVQLEHPVPEQEQGNTHQVA